MDKLISSARFVLKRLSMHLIEVPELVSANQSKEKYARFINGF
jgi:hypothetical protein